MSDITNDVLKFNVLVVEDNKINQLLIKNMLKKFGFVNFDTVDNSNMAFYKLDEKKYDIILMDIQLPGMSGFEITELIRAKKDDSYQMIPIIALTGDGHEKNRLRANESGMNGYLVKPFMPEELYSLMMKCLNVPVSGDQTTQLNRFKSINQAKSLINKEQGMNLLFLEKYTGHDGELTIKLIETFLLEVPEAIIKLEQLIPVQHWKEVHSVSHKVKSCITIFELSDLKQIIVAIEDSSREIQQVDEIPSLFFEFKTGCNEVINRLKKELALLKVHQS